MENYIPDIYQKSIYTIDYQKLKDRGIKCLLFDLDNTLVPVSTKGHNKKIKALFDELKKDFKVILFSNSPKKRLKLFTEGLDVDYVASALKPFPKNFLYVLNKYNYNVSEVAIIGDRLLTDILGGNKVGITTVLINPISTKDALSTKFLRIIENKIIYKLRNKNLFTKGKYYD